MNIPGYKIIGPLAYRGKVGCQNVTCTHMVSRDENGKVVFGDSCLGWHCSYCDEPCSSQGHRCDAAVTLLAEAERLMRETEDAA